MKIVQISDLHVGSQFLQEKFDILVEEVNEINPDVIVITGDLTNEGFLRIFCHYILLSNEKTKN